MLGPQVGPPEKVALSERARSREQSKAVASFSNTSGGRGSHYDSKIADYASDKTQITPPSLLISGSNKHIDSELGKKLFREFCNELGKRLANKGFRIIVGSTDEPTADRQFLEGANQVTAVRNIQVITRTEDVHQGPTFAELQTQLTNLDLTSNIVLWNLDWPEVRRRQVEPASLVLLVGGSTGTMHIAEAARERGKLVIPIGAANGSAEEVFDWFSMNLKTHGVTDNEMERLRKAYDVDLVEKLVMRLIGDSDCQIAIREYGSPGQNKVPSPDHQSLTNSSVDKSQSERKNDTQPKVLFALHGIRTRGDWVKIASDVLAESNSGLPAGWITRLDGWHYGKFNLLQFLMPWSRSAKVEWFRARYEKEMDDKTLPINEQESQYPSVIAHSFGTYILGNTLIKYKDVRFNKVILVGSILPRDFPWQALMQRGQVRAVRNEYGVDDIWTVCSSWIIPGTGASGTRGFNALTFPENAPQFQQEEYLYKHSDYFTKRHIRENWRIFLEQKVLSALNVDDLTIQRPEGDHAFAQRGNSWILLLIVILIAFAIVWALTLLIPKPNPITPEVVTVNRNGEEVPEVTENQQGHHVELCDALEKWDEKDDGPWMPKLDPKDLSSFPAKLQAKVQKLFELPEPLMFKECKLVVGENRTTPRYKFECFVTFKKEDNKWDYVSVGGPENIRFEISADHDQSLDGGPYVVSGGLSERPELSRMTPDGMPAFWQVYIGMNKAEVSMSKSH